MANSTIVYACTDDGLAIFNKPGTLPEWLPPRRVLQGQHITAAWAEPGPPIRVLVVADGALLYSENGGRTWEAAGPEEQMSEPVRSIRYDATSHILEVLTEAGARWRSTDSGMTWQVADSGDVLPDDPSEEYRAKLPEDALAFVAIPGGAGMPPALIAGMADGLQASPDGGVTWVQTNLPHGGAVTALARDPERRDRLYAAIDTGYLFESGNRGQTWQAVNVVPVAGVLTMYVVRI